MIDFSVQKTGLEHNIQKARENHIIIPTIAQMQHPTYLPRSDGKIAPYLKKYCSERKQVNDSTSSYGRGMKKDSVAEETTVGGATMFVLNVEEYDKI